MLSNITPKARVDVVKSFIRSHVRTLSYLLSYQGGVAILTTQEYRQLYECRSSHHIWLILLYVILSYISPWRNYNGCQL